MKILFFHRAKNFGFSFEALFKTIKNHLIDCEVHDYYDKTYPSFWTNLKAVKNIECDLIHITGGIGYYALFLPTKKTILTIHDTNHYECDLKGIKKWLFGLMYYKLPISNVAKVTVVSEDTKKNIITFFGVNPSKIEVIPNCYPSEFKHHKKETVSNKFNILHIGTKSNKNLEGLIKAAKGLNVQLTIVGKVPPSIKKLLEDSKITYENKYALSSSEIYQEYIHCDMVHFCSFYEGFGLPIIEANVVGRPVITSNLSPMTEVAGKGACFVNPYAIDEIRKGIIRIKEDEEYRNKLINLGIANAKKYEPTHIASQYLNLYQSI